MRWQSLGILHNKIELLHLSALKNRILLELNYILTYKK